MVLGEPEGLENLKGQVQHAADFALHLLRHAENMGVVLSEPAHPHQAVHHPAALVAVHRAQLANANWQLTVAV